mgnify:CR=1 FL=1
MLQRLKQLLAGFREFIRRHIYRRRSPEIIITRPLTADDLNLPPHPVQVHSITDEWLGPLREFAARVTGKGQNVSAWTEWSLANGYKGYLGVLDGRVVGCVWYGTRQTPVEHPSVRRLRIDLRDDDAYMYALYVDPEARGGGIGTHLVAALHAGLYAAGCRRVVAYVLKNNAPARAIYRRMGYTEGHHRPSSCLFGRLYWYDTGLFVDYWPEGLNQPLDMRPLLGR